MAEHIEELSKIDDKLITGDAGYATTPVSWAEQHGQGET
jgi:hypothetical protein